MHSRLRRSCLGIFLGLMLLTTVPACGVQQIAKGELQPPKVTFQGLKIYQPTARGWPLGATLLLENPNSQSLDLLGYNYQLWIEGKSVAQGVSQQAVTLPAMGQAVAEVPIVVQLPALMELLPHFLSQQQQERKLHYQIAGSFRLASVMGGIIPIPFKFQGEATPQEGKDFLSPYLR